MSTVTIGCKLPNGIVMQVGEARHRINGWNNNEIAGLSHGITRDVPEDLWDAWRAEHADAKFITNGIVFAETSEARAKDKSKDRKEQKTGHEQLPQIKATEKAGVLGKSDA